MKNKKRGFAPLILIVFAVVTAFLAAGGVIGYRKYQSVQNAKEEESQQKQIAIEENNAKIAALEEKLQQLETGTPKNVATTSLSQDDSAKKELEELKKQNLALKTERKVSLPVTKISTEKPMAPVLPPAPSAHPGILGVTQLIAQVKPGVAAIDTRTGSGSGILVAKNAILTNAHVVADVYRVKVQLEGNTITGYVAARNEDEDIAIIAIPETTIAPLVLGDSTGTGLGQGEPVYTFGFPFGLSGDVSFKEAVLSRRMDFEGKSYLEISNGIHPGNSGGPLVNSRGEVVGINEMIVGRIKDGTLVGESIKLSIPINHAKQIFAPMLSRAHLPSSEKKKQIDDFEDYMTALGTVVSQYNTAYDDYNSYMTQGDTDYLKLVYEQFGDPLAGADKLVKNSPILPFAGSMRDAAYSMKQIIDNTRDFIQNESRRYLVSKNTQSVTTAADKDYLDKRVEGNNQKIAQYKTYIDVVNREAAKVLTYY